VNTGNTWATAVVQDPPANAAVAAAVADRVDVADLADPATAVLATLAQLGSGPAPRFNPTRWHYLQALARRLAAQTGPVRAVLAQRLGQALSAYCQAQAQAQAEAVAPGRVQPLAAPTRHPPSALGSLVGRLNRGRAPVAEDGFGGTQGDAHHEGPAAPTALAQTPPAPPALKAVQQARSTWARLSVDRQLARSQAQVPDNPGPLNSHLLVLRALQAMQATSPTYLGHFMAYADALLWLDQASFGGPSPSLNVVRREGEAPEPGKPGKPGKPASKPRRVAAKNTTGQR
jgi:hypothetical protein